MRQTLAAQSLNLGLLLDDLPSAPENIEDQARNVLRVLLERKVDGSEPWAEDPLTCPNCGIRNESLRSPYCSDICRERSAFVRQFRSSVESGQIEDSERQVALGQKLWHLVGAGRPLRFSIAPRRAIEQAIKREGGICQVCGDVATTIDHATGSG